ncbi:hypothetical protein ALC60_12840 [Trachymyrmex zeteki]|uniref:Uncharacterized protein n=1 Tax=Mycetomoellerius zeteki TaxID=64791 RepID=A0A151WJU2_9HYME|nr:hypothetical protein ALC60_12840 [Trachymyrmex zeteki]
MVMGWETRGKRKTARRRRERKVPEPATSVACPEICYGIMSGKLQRSQYRPDPGQNQMSDICKKYFLRDLYRKIDGAVLTSQNERDLDCAITFQTHSILQRFMLRFDQLQLDCNDHLYIYDGAHAVGSYKIYIADYSRGAKRTDIAICATSPTGYGSLMRE